MRSAVLAIALSIAFASELLAADLPSGGSGPDGVLAPPGTREALQKEFRKSAQLTKHLDELKEPRRRVDARALGLPSLAMEAYVLVVVGPITDEELKKIAAVHELEAPLSKVVGDMKFARLYLGDPNKQPCCFGEWTYAKESGEWQLISKYERSH